MLVLSRRPGEVIHVGDDIQVHVVRITPNNVRIGITAPRTTFIVRGELVERKSASVCTCRVEARDGDTVLRECEACRRRREDE